MATREQAPVGAPCWVDLWTEDPAGAAAFYGAVLGWEAEEPSLEHGGYFMFTCAGVPVAGGMGGMLDMPASNLWKVYLATDDMTKTLQVAEGAGAQVVVAGMAVDDLGVQGVVVDPTGADVGIWQPGTFPGFTVLGEAGAPAWFELRTPSFDAGVAFYRTAFGWDTEDLPGEHGIRYTTMRHPDAPMAGIFGDPDPVAPSRWAVYFAVADVDGALATVTELGGAADAPFDSPYGRMAAVTDPYGAAFRLVSAST